MKKTLFFTTVLAICFSFFTTITFADCDPGDSNCNGFADAMGLVRDNFNQNFGNPNDTTDTENGGFFAGDGRVCLTATGNNFAKTVGEITSDASGSYDPAEQTSISRSTMDLFGKSKFKDTGKASLEADGAVEESSYVSKAENTFYGTSGQIAATTFTHADDLDSTTSDKNKLVFEASLAACGEADLNILNKPGHIRVEATEKNQTDATFSTTPNDQSASANVATSAGIISGGAKAEGYTTGNIVCEKNVWTNGSTISDIKQTIAPNEYQSNSKITARQQIGGQD